MSPWKDYYKCGLFVASCRALYHGERKIPKKKKVNAYIRLCIS